MSILIFMAIGLLISIVVSPFVARPFEKIEKDSAMILEARKRSDVLLNDMLAAYARDILEQKKILGEIESRDRFLDALNNAAAILLKSEIDDFESDLHNCMGMIARAMDIDRMYIWRNHEEDGKLYHTQMYEWAGGAEPRKKTAYAVDLRRCKKLPGLEEALLSGNRVSGLVRDMPSEDQAIFSCEGIQSFFIMPVFLRGEFRGLIGYDDCHRKRVFTGSEQSALSLAGNILASAVFQNETAKDLTRGSQGKQKKNF